VVKTMPWPIYSWERDLVSNVQEAGWAPGPVCTGVENFTPTRIHCADREACSELLHHLCYPGPFCTKVLRKNFNSYMFIKFVTEYVTEKTEKLLLVKVSESINKLYLATITRKIKKESEYINNILTEIFGMC
jgi:hypothetical protein